MTDRFNRLSAWIIQILLLLLLLGGAAKLLILEASSINNVWIVSTLAIGVGSRAIHM